MWIQMVPQGSGSATNEPVALDTDFDGEGDCGANATLPAISTGTGSQGVKFQVVILKHLLQIILV